MGIKPLNRAIGSIFLAGYQLAIFDLNALRLGWVSPGQVEIGQ